MLSSIRSVASNLEWKGYTYLGCIDGESIFCNLDLEKSVSACLDYVNEKTGKVWGYLF